MTTWFPGDMPPEFEPERKAHPPAQPPSPLGASTHSLSPQAAPHQASSLSRFGTEGAPHTYQPASAYAPIPPHEQPRSPRTRLWVLVLGVGLALGLASLIPLVIRATADYSPAYVGSPVEASDASDPLVVVGYDDRVSFHIDPRWIEVGTLAREFPELATVQKDEDLLAAYFTRDPSASDAEFVMLFALEPPLPRPALRNAHADGMELFIDQYDGSAIGPSAPIVTANGLRGHSGTYSADLSGAPATSRLVLLGNGGTVVLIHWTSFAPTLDEVEFREFLNSVRIDD